MAEGIDFTYDLTTDVGRFRLAVGDNDKSSVRWTDTAITEFITQGGTWERAIGVMAQAEINRIAIGGKAVTIDTTTGEDGTKTTTENVVIDDAARLPALQVLLQTYGGGTTAVTLPKATMSYHARLPQDPYST